MAQCAGTKPDGTRCSLGVPPGVEHCYNHDPHRVEERRRNAARAGRRRPNNEARELKDQLSDLYNGVLIGTVDPKVGAVAAQIAGARIRLLETERKNREEEELVRRIEELEKQGGNECTIA